MEIRYRKDKAGEVIYGEHLLDGVTTLHCAAELYDGETLMDTKRIVGIPFEGGEAVRDAKAQEAFKDIKPGDPPKTKPVKPDTSLWTSTLTKAAIE